MGVEEITNLVNNGTLLGARNVYVLLKLIGYKTIAAPNDGQIVDFESWDKVGILYGDCFASIRSHTYVKEIPVKACPCRTNGRVRAKQVECFRGAKTNVVGSDANHFHGPHL